MNRTDITDRIVSWTCDRDAMARALPRHVVRTVRDAWLDTVGVIGLGAEYAAEAPALRAACIDPRGAGAYATALGRVELPQTAAFVNSALAHSMDYDDSHNGSQTHPSAVILPAAWAAASGTAASFDDVVAACAAGYEVLTRLGALAPGRLAARGFHPTSVLGAVGAAVTAARLLALGPDAARAALGLAASLSSGVTRPVIEGREGKAFSIANAAAAGVLAARLAAAGIPPMASPLEGDGALLASFLGIAPEDLDRSRFDDLGERWASAEIVVKRYPCCHFTHSAIDAALVIRGRIGTAHEAVTAIEVDVPDAYLPFVWNSATEHRAPQTGYGAKFNLPFVLASALRHGRIVPESFAGEALRDPAVLRLANLVTLRRSDPFPEFPGTYPARVSVSAGTVREEVRVAAGPAETVADVEAKARHNLGLRLGEDRAGTVIAEWPLVHSGAVHWEVWLQRALVPQAAG